MMESLRARLTDAVSTLEADGYLLDASTDDPNQRYVTGFEVTDPFVSLVTEDGVSQLYWGVDHQTAQSRGFADDVYSASDFGYSGFGDPDAEKRVVRQFVRRHDVESIAVPERFPVGTARALEDSVTVAVPDRNPVTELRARKTQSEVRRIRAAAEAADAAMTAVSKLLADATVTGDGLVRDGDLVTGRLVEERIRDAVAETDCTTAEALVASGVDASDPHGNTRGGLDPGAPIVVDVVPRHPDGYHADVCRTFFAGDSPDRIQNRYELVLDVLDAAGEQLEPGMGVTQVNDVLCGTFEERGIPTPRTEPDADSGVLHYAAHGVGLNVHEAPLCTSDSDAVLEPGTVLAVEPAVYDPEWGGIRIEDTFQVTGGGTRRLSTSDRDPWPR